MNKKGIALSFEMGWFIFIVIFLVFLLGALSFAIHIGTTKIYETEDVSNFVYVSNIVNAKNGIMKYNEEIDRVYPAIVSNFESSVLDESLYYEETGNEIPAAKLTLTRLDDSNTTKEIFWHQNWYERLVIKSALRGSGAPASYRTTRLVHEEVEGKLIHSRLDFHILVPKVIKYEQEGPSLS